MFFNVRVLSIKNDRAVRKELVARTLRKTRQATESSSAFFGERLYAISGSSPSLEIVPSESDMALLARTRVASLSGFFDPVANVQRAVIEIFVDDAAFSER